MREPESLQGGCRQARLTALVAHEDYKPVEAFAQRRIAVSGRWVEAPLQRVARDKMGARYHAVALALVFGADVDQDRAADHGVARLLGFESSESAASGIE